MATSRPIRQGDSLTRLNDEGPRGYGAHQIALGSENTQEFALHGDFGLTLLFDGDYHRAVCDRVFGVPDCVNFRDPRLAAAITNGTAPGLYVREGDDTSDWETYRQVLARRVEEAVAARRGGGGGDSDETTATVRRFGPGPRMCSTNGLFVGVNVELPVGGVTPGVQVTPTATRRDDEIRVGDVVEVVSNTGLDTLRSDIGRGGRVVAIDHLRERIHVDPVEGLRLPGSSRASLADVRKISSPPQRSPIGVAISPMLDEAARVVGVVGDEMRRRSVVDAMRRATPRDFTTAAITDYLQSLGATSIRVNLAPGAYLPVIEVTGLSQQAFDTARQNLPVGVQLRAADGVVRRRDGVEATRIRGSAATTTLTGECGQPRPIVASLPPSQTPSPPSRFSLLEVDVDAASPPPPQAPKPSTGLAALQQELRAEREAKRALAAVQTPPGRFDLLECDLPAIPATVAAKPAKAPQPQRPVVTSPPPKPLDPVETITDLTTARSPLELARILEGLNDELSTMMRQREAN